MRNYTDDPQLRSLRDVISDPKNKLNKIKFAKGALYKDSIHIHPEDDNIDRKIYFAFVRASKLLISSAYQRYICVSTIKKAKQFHEPRNLSSGSSVLQSSPRNSGQRLGSGRDTRRHCV